MAPVSVAANKILMTKRRYVKEALGGKACSSSSSPVVVEGSAQLGHMDLLPDKYFLYTIRETH